MKEFYDQGWERHLIRKADDVPKSRHWQVMTFGYRSVYEPGWDASHPGSWNDEPEVKHYFFEKKDMLEAFLAEVVRSDTPFVFYEVSNLGKIEVRLLTRVEV